MSTSDGVEPTTATDGTVTESVTTDPAPSTATSHEPSGEGIGSDGVSWPARVAGAAGGAAWA